MATAIKSGARSWSLQVDDEGHRVYKIKWLVKSDTTDGPANVLRTAGLPTVGSIWSFDSDVDVWAWCRYEASVQEHEKKEGEPHRWWTVEQTFSTKPVGRCQDTKIENPLLEPAKVSGGLAKFTEEATLDRFGFAILNSAHEQIRGPQNEWAASQPTVKIEQNVASLNLALHNAMVNGVNEDAMWGLPARTIRLVDFSWAREFFGSCQVYYKRSLEFEINHKTWDRDVLDEGTKCLHGRWNPGTRDYDLVGIGGAASTTSVPPNPDPNNPSHFDRFLDRNGVAIKGVLDGAGKPFNPAAASKTTGCSVCATGAPTVWRLYGFSEDETNYIPLTYTSSCTWRNAAVGAIEGLDTEADDVQLFYSIATSFWRLEGSVGGVLLFRYEKDGDDWQCMGPANEMSRDAAVGANLPATVTVKIQPASAPGSRHIEKYPSVNFLQLGIPLTF